MNSVLPQFVFIDTATRQLVCYDNNNIVAAYAISSAKNGLGELQGSECTPRGWHTIHAVIGMEAAVNSVFVSRKFTGEIYSPELQAAHPTRDWILTRIIQLDGLESGRNKNGAVDTLMRYVYIHGTPDSTDLTQNGSHGCIRMHNHDMIAFANWISVGTKVCIE
jgi:lipoprotein-anchoring transpeptidase ErfK/SrfK